MLKTKIMGILNVTPDSFLDGGKFIDVEKAVQHAKQMIDEGADIIDVGGESSRPGSDPVSKEEELKRVLDVVRRLSKEVNVPISIDTYKPEVAEECIKCGAEIVNDISGLRNDKMIEVVAKYGVKVIVMHMLGEPKTMQDNIDYDDVILDIKKFLKERIEKAKLSGIKDIVIDPGIGFGKTVENNLEILRRLKEFKALGCPILVGASRKSFIGKITGLDVDERLEGTIAANVIAVMNGAEILRVHDVKECKRAIQIAEAIIDDNKDKIIIKDSKFMCNVGVEEEERKDKQEIIVDIELYHDLGKAGKSDDINKTINYSDVIKLVSGVVEGEHKLIESMAEDIAKAILNNYDVEEVKISVKKPNALDNAKYAGVEIVRKKNG